VRQSLRQHGLPYRSRGNSPGRRTRAAGPGGRPLTPGGSHDLGPGTAKAAESPNHPWLMEGQEPVILAAGRLSPEKGFSTLIQAFARLAAKRACRLVILGEGRQRGDLERLVNDSRLMDRVSMPGWTTNPFAYMSRAALFVLSSVREGLGLVLIEALACGCPCVSTDCPSGPREILQGGDLAGC